MDSFIVPGGFTLAGIIAVLTFHKLVIMPGIREEVRKIVDEQTENLVHSSEMKDVKSWLGRIEDKIDRLLMERGGKK